MAEQAAYLAVKGRPVLRANDDDVYTEHPRGIVTEAPSLGASVANLLGTS